MEFQQKCVENFMAGIGETFSSEPRFPTKKHAKLRKKLVREEVGELCKAIDECDLLEIADGIGDALYVILGTASAYGLDAAAIFEEVHRSNMTKLKDGHRRADGKWVKGPSFEPPKLKQFIK